MIYVTVRCVVIKTLIGQKKIGFPTSRPLRRSSKTALLLFATGRRLRLLHSHNAISRSLHSHDEISTSLCVHISFYRSLRW